MCAVVVAIEYETLLDAVYQCLCVSREAVCGQGGLVVEAEYLWLVPGLNIVTGRLPGVAGDYAEILPSDGKNGAT